MKLHQTSSCYDRAAASEHTLWPHLHEAFPYVTSHVRNVDTACYYCVTVVVVVVVVDVVDVDVVVIVVVVLSTIVVAVVLFPTPSSSFPSISSSSS